MLQIGSKFFPIMKNNTDLIPKKQEAEVSSLYFKLHFDR